MIIYWLSSVHLYFCPPAAAGCRINIKYKGCGSDPLMTTVQQAEELWEVSLQTEAPQWDQLVPAQDLNLLMWSELDSDCLWQRQEAPLDAGHQKIE